MALADIAAAHYAAQAQLARRAMDQAAVLWAGLEFSALTASWEAAVAEPVFVAVSTGQLLAAAAADPYVTAAVQAQGADDAVDGALQPTAFAGIASDGRDLESLLYEPVITTKQAIGQGASPADALSTGRAALMTIVGTQVADMGRAAVAAAMATRPAVTGWVRMLTPPSCGRCAVLAGRRYKRNAGFNRHPRCDCVAIPAAEDAADDLQTDPKAYFNSLSEQDQDRYFTVSGARAIRDGADIGQVVNARRGAQGLSQPGRLTLAEQQMLRGGRDRGRLQRVDVYGRQVYVTTEGTTRRGLAGSRLGAWSDDAVKDPDVRNKRARTPRLMPESIYDLAGDDREEAVRLLRRFGYIR